MSMLILKLRCFFVTVCEGQAHIYFLRGVVFDKIDIIPMFSPAFG